jgi:pyruvate dehydrogenase E2 component (dihydrolipoamide acetyltransferase)
MATEVKLPRLGQGMESGTIVRWLKTEGDAVVKGEPLYELDTDKVTQEVEAESDGVLLKIAVPVKCPWGPSCLHRRGEDRRKPEPGPRRELPDPGEPEAAAGSAARRGDAAPPEARPSVVASGSPLARRIARERGIDLATLRGTGPEGRVVAEDVERGWRPPLAAPAARHRGRDRDPMPGRPSPAG